MKDVKKKKMEEGERGREREQKVDRQKHTEIPEYGQDGKGKSYTRLLGKPKSKLVSLIKTVQFVDN